MDVQFHLGSRLYVQDVPKYPELCNKILREAHTSQCVVHSSVVKGYHNVPNIYWWPGLKKDVVEVVSNCLVC